MGLERRSAEKVDLILRSIEKNLDKLKEEGITFDDALRILNARKEDSSEGTVPLSIFSSELGPLESLVKYMKEELSLTYKEIALILNRNAIPIGVSYRNAVSKLPSRLDTMSERKIPLSIFSKRRFSVLEALTSYLKESCNMSFHDIAFALNRDDRTIWTVYSRYRNKNER